MVVISTTSYHTGEESHPSCINHCTHRASTVAPTSHPPLHPPRVHRCTYPPRIHRCARHASTVAPVARPLLCLSCARLVPVVRPLLRPSCVRASLRPSSHLSSYPSSATYEGCLGIQFIPIGSRDLPLLLAYISQMMTNGEVMGSPYLRAARVCAVVSEDRRKGRRESARHRTRACRRRQ